MDEYYLKFMEYMRFRPEDVPTKGKKMQRFELGLTFTIKKHVESGKYETQDQMYKRAA